MPAAALTTLAAVKTFAGQPGNASDAVLQPLVDGASVALGNYLNRALDEHAFTEYRNGTGSAMLSLANYPIVSISSIFIDGIALAAGDFSAFPGTRVIVLKNGRVFRRDMRNVQIIGVAGYGGAIAWPSDLQLAAHYWILARFNERSRIGVGSKSLAGESISYSGPDPAVGSASTGMPAAAKTILSNYANVVPETGT